MSSPAPREMKRLFSAEVSVRVGLRSSSGLAPCTFSLSIPGLDIGLSVSGEVGAEGLDAIRSTDGAAFALAGRAMNRLIGEALAARVAAMGDPIPSHESPDVAVLQAELQELREKYDRLFCSHLGLLHD